MIKLYNTRSKKVEEFTPYSNKRVTVYSCGPTVYDHIHIGNLFGFIVADTLHRVLSTKYTVKHVMNFTDVDDKTIKRSSEQFPDLDPFKALIKLTTHFSEIFLKDILAVGNKVDDLKFTKATDNIDGIRQLISSLYDGGFAYITTGGVYFSIQKYKASGKTYGQLLTLTTENTSSARIDNDEYDKASVHDFALWKIQKDNEPAWEFKLGGQTLNGRPGWHIECSVMSTINLGQPFDIHTGGVDLIFPHHENEIAQSTAGKKVMIYANFFVHNEYLLVNGRKMSKSLQNFLTLEDIQKRGFDPTSFRLMVLQAHYRTQTNFTWEGLSAAQNRLKDLRAMADLRWQLADVTLETNKEKLSVDETTKMLQSIQDALDNDLDTPQALYILSEAQDRFTQAWTSQDEQRLFEQFLEKIDALLGLQLMNSTDITKQQKALLYARKQARADKAWDKADTLRKKLLAESIGIRDTASGQVWYRL